MERGPVPGAVVLKEQEQVLARDQEGVRDGQAPVVVRDRRQLRLRVRRQHRQLVERVPACAQAPYPLKPCLTCATSCSCAIPHSMHEVLLAPMPCTRMFSL